MPTGIKSKSFVDIWTDAGREEPGDLYLIARHVHTTPARKFIQLLRDSGWTVEEREATVRRGP